MLGTLPHGCTHIEKTEPQCSVSTQDENTSNSNTPGSQSATLAADCCVIRIFCAQNLPGDTDLLESESHVRKAGCATTAARGVARVRWARGCSGGGLAHNAVGIRGPAHTVLACLSLGARHGGRYLGDLSFVWECAVRGGGGGTCGGNAATCQRGTREWEPRSVREVWSPFRPWRDGPHQHYFCCVASEDDHRSWHLRRRQYMTTC